jgi:hypothetical protein
MELVKIHPRLIPKVKRLNRSTEKEAINRNKIVTAASTDFFVHMPGTIL